MRAKPRQVAILGIILTCALPGCFSTISVLGRADFELRHLVSEIPRANKSRVYIFMANTHDPIKFNDLMSLRETLGEAGFTRTYFGQVYDAAWLFRELYRQYQCDPEGRYVVIGYQGGAWTARKVAEYARAAEIPVDGLVYIDPPQFLAHSRLEVVPSLVIATEKGPLDDEEMDPRILRVNRSKVWNPALHPKTINRLLADLSDLAATVPVSTEAPDPFPPIDVDERVLPRPLSGNNLLPRDEKDFSKLPKDPLSGTNKVRETDHDLLPPPRLVDPK